MAWYAIQCLPQCEHKAKVSIERMGINVQMPVIVERRQRFRGGAFMKTETYKPMFSGYVFLEATYVPEWLNKDYSVLRPLPSWDAPRVIPDSLVQAALSRSGEITVDEWKRIQRFAAGDTVRRKGDASGLTMKVLGDDDQSLVVLVEFLGKLHRKVIPYTHVEAAE